MWNNVSVQNCKAVWDVLNKINKYAGVTLPDGKTSNELLKTKSGEILDFGQRVLDDDELWDSIPEKFVGPNNRLIKKMDLRVCLKELLDESR